MSRLPSSLAIRTYLSRKSLLVYVVALTGVITNTIVLHTDDSDASAAPHRSTKDTSGPVAALARRTIYVKEAARLLPVGSVGTVIKEKGNATGTFNGVVTSNLAISGNHISGTFALTTKNGKINGHTSATIIGQAAVPVVHFAGSLSITGGSGNYAHATGDIPIKGTIRRRNYELVEQVSGAMRY